MKRVRSISSHLENLESTAIAYSSFGTPHEVATLKKLPLAAPTKTSILLKMLAAPIHPANLNALQGVYPIKPDFTKTPWAVGGSEGVAQVVEVGESVDSFKVGDWVLPANFSFGTWQDYVRVEASTVFTLPGLKSLSLLQAANLSVNPPSAYHMLKDFVSLKRGDIVIQNGANSAVGQAVIQMCAFWGIKTINVVRDRPDLSSLVAQLKSLGATHVISEKGLRDSKLMATLKDQGTLKLALNCVGGKAGTDLARWLDNNGIYVTYGAMSKGSVEVPASLFIFKNITLRGFWLSGMYDKLPFSRRLEMLKEVIKIPLKDPLVNVVPFDKVNLKEVLKFDGESGLGKSTLVNTLFGAHLYPQKEAQELSTESPKTVEIQAISADLEENGVKLKLTIVDTPGFGDFVNNEDSWKPILENIEARYDAYLEQESRVNRKKVIDTRIHACLYFIAPTGHSLKALDIEFMKRLGSRVNLIPVIAKADTLTEDEVKSFKARILQDIASNNIPIYQPSTHENDDPETAAESQAILAKMPFAVVGSDLELDIGGKKVRGRKYPWGVIEVENEQHCDFVKLRQMLIQAHMEELKEQTNEILYENYRTQKLSDGSETKTSSGTPFAKFDAERTTHEQKMAKMEAEMKAVFQQKVAEKEAKLKQSEDELYARHREMKDQLERQRLDLDERKKRLESSRSQTPDKMKKSKGLFK